MVDVMTSEASSCDLKELVAKLIPEVIGKEIEKATMGIFPLQNVYVRKVKMLKTPKFDHTKLMELHQGGDDVGEEVLRVEEGEDDEGEGEGEEAEKEEE